MFWDGFFLNVSTGVEKNVLQFLPISAHNQIPPIALSKLTSSLLNVMAYMVKWPDQEKINSNT